MDQALIKRRRMKDNNPKIIIYWDSSSVVTFTATACVLTLNKIGVDVSAYGLSS